MYFGTPRWRLPDSTRKFHGKCEVTATGLYRCAILNQMCYTESDVQMCDTQSDVNIKSSFLVHGCIIGRLQYWLQHKRPSVHSGKKTSTQTMYTTHSHLCRHHRPSVRRTRCQGSRLWPQHVPCFSGTVQMREHNGGNGSGSAYMCSSACTFTRAHEFFHGREKNQ